MAYLDNEVNHVSGVIEATLTGIVNSKLRAPMTQPVADAEFPALVVYRESEEAAITNGGILRRRVNLKIGYYIGRSTSAQHEDEWSLLEGVAGLILLAIRRRSHASYASGKKLEDPTLIPGLMELQPGSVVYKLAMPDADESGSYPAVELTAVMTYDDTTYATPEALLHILGYINDLTEVGIPKLVEGFPVTTKADPTP